MPRDTQRIECLLESMADYVTAKQERDRARDSYEGYSWGYFGSDYENRVAKKAAEVEDRLADVIEAIIAERKTA